MKIKYVYKYGDFLLIFFSLTSGDWKPWKWLHFQLYSFHIFDGILLVKTKAAHDYS
jgi:hypothetical protein